MTVNGIKDLPKFYKISPGKIGHVLNLRKVAAAMWGGNEWSSCGGKGRKQALFWKS